MITVIKGVRIKTKYGWILERGTLVFLKEGAYKCYIDNSQYDPNRRHGRISDKSHPMYEIIEKYL